MKTHDMLDIGNKMRTICSVEQKTTCTLTYFASKKLKASARFDNTLISKRERKFKININSTA